MPNNADNVDQMVVVEEEDDEEQPLASAVTGSNSGHLGVPQQWNQPQSVILRSNNPLNSNSRGNSKNGAEGGPFNFDMQSKSSAYFANDNEMAEYEEKMQSKVQEKWDGIEKKMEELQR